MNRATAGILTSAFSLVAAAAALAGGTPENAVLIIDPTNPVSMYVGNYYKNARNIPEANVLYVRSAAADYGTFVATNQAAFIDALGQRGITDHADYVVLAPVDTFFVPAAGLVSDTCSPVTRFSLSSAYTMAQISALITPGGNSSQLLNTYYFANDAANAFDAEHAYVNGAQSTSGLARRYFIGAMLGYTSGSLGNTVPQILTMIDRSVAADGARPAGKFYYMNNLSDSARNVRACGGVNCATPTFYNTAHDSIVARNGSSLVLSGILPPTNTADCLGIMTGNAFLDFASANLTLIPGAFGDHLTSYGAALDINDQTKVSAWIAAGASGSAGTVEEPCNFTGKFPGARFHVYYFQGLSLGESYLRSVQFVPFQNLLYGDPLTRPFAYIPTVNVANAPTGVASGAITLTPTAAAAGPGSVIAGYDLLVDGVRVAGANLGQSFSLDTTTLSDGRHDLRVLARDSTTVKNVGRWTGTLDTANYGRAATLGVSPSAGDLAQLFSFTYAAGGAAVREVRLIQNGRVLAASTAPTGTLSVYGQNLGAGASTVRLEATYVDNRLVRSVPVSVNVSSSGTPAGPAPVAFNYTKNLLTQTAFVVELPATFDADPGAATYTLLNTPVKATIVQAGATLPYAILRPNAGAAGSEPLQFRVTTPAGQSGIATVTLVYTLPAVCRADFNVDGQVTVSDIFAFLSAWFAGSPTADFNGVGGITVADIFAYLSAWFTNCP